jgi:hypothetical protein
MTKKELPETLFIPSVQLSQGAIDIQLYDENGNIAILAWSTGDRAANWLRAGGMDLWKRHESNLEQRLKTGKIVIRIVSCSEYFTLNSFLPTTPGSLKRALHFEPDTGSLFSPPGRRIPFA